jgi:Bacterial Ig domain
MRHIVLNLLLIAAAMTAHAATAAGVFVPASQRIDMVHDDLRGVVYITNGGEVLRYDVARRTFLSPIVLGGNLAGIDISADNETLAVADRTSTATHVHIHLVSLRHLSSLWYLAARKVSAPKEFSEGGTYSVAFGYDGKLRVTSTFNGSGWVPLRQLDPATDTWTTLTTVRQNSMLSASGDRNTVAFAESNISDGSWGLLDIPTGGLVQRQGYTNGTSWFNFEIATDMLGSQFAIPTYNGAYIYDDAYRNIARIGQYAGPQPIGAAYHPVKRIAYFPWAQTREIRAYDMGNFRQIATYDFEHDFVHTGNHAYGQGRIRISQDGSLLMVSVNGGVRVLRTYAPLNAESLTVAAVAGVRKSFLLPGTIGNADALTYSISQGPQHGRVSIYGNTATYLAPEGFVGTDTFAYRAHYGQAVREGSITVSVGAVNAAPIAIDNSAIAGHRPVSIPVLANDRDANGDDLRIVAVTQPRFGHAVVDGDRIRFIPAARWQGAVRFRYTVSDGRGGLAHANVTVAKR